MKRITFVLAISSIFFVAHHGVKAAQTSYQGLSLRPAITQLTINPDQAQISYKISIDNGLSLPVNVKVTSLDFKSLNETGGLVFIGNNAADIEHKYGLAKWIETPSGLINIPSDSTQSVDIKVDNRPDLAPGGHYAAILFELVAPGSSITNHVGVDQAISSLLFVRKSGGEIYNIDLTNITVHRNFAWFGWPSRLDSVFNNTGNVQTAPRGVITLDGTNTVLNPDSSLVLPGSTRLLNTDLSPIKAPFWPGFYHLKLSYRPDGSSRFKTVSPGFVYIGWRFLTALSLLILAILAGLPRRARQPLLRSIGRVGRRSGRTTLGLMKSGRYVYRSLRWFICKPAKLIWNILVHLDYLAGKALLRWDKRRAKKARKN